MVAGGSGGGTARESASTRERTPLRSGGTNDAVLRRSAYCRGGGRPGKTATRVADSIDTDAATRAFPFPFPSPPSVPEHRRPPRLHPYPAAPPNCNDCFGQLPKARLPRRRRGCKMMQSGRQSKRNVPSLSTSSLPASTAASCACCCYLGGQFCPRLRPSSSIGRGTHLLRVQGVFLHLHRAD